MYVGSGELVDDFNDGKPAVTTASVMSVASSQAG